MPTNHFIQELQAIIAERHLLQHPFYQMWSQGTLPLQVLQHYAEQYYHFETAFPKFLSKIHASCDQLDVRQTITDNLYDEEHGSENHRELWLRFGEGVGADRNIMQRSEQLEETQDLLQTFYGLAEASTLEGIGALAAYETQVPAVSESKIQGLKEHYHIDDAQTLRFFTVHGILDQHHADAWWKNIEDHATTPEVQKKVQGAVVAGRDALWRFLDGICRAYMPEMN